MDQKKMGIMGAAIGFFSAVIVNASRSMPYLRNPWTHVISAGVYGVLFYKLPDIEESAKQMNAKALKRWERRRLRDTEVSKRFLAALEESEQKVEEKFKIIEKLKARRNDKD